MTLQPQLYTDVDAYLQLHRKLSQLPGASTSIETLATRLHWTHDRTQRMAQYLHDVALINDSPQPLNDTPQKADPPG